MSNGQRPHLNEDDRRALRALIDNIGHTAAARRLNVSVQTLAKAAANLPIQVTTATHLHVMLATKENGDASAA